jgi:hypothetical protein
MVKLNGDTLFWFADCAESDDDTFLFDNKRVCIEQGILIGVDLFVVAADLFLQLEITTPTSTLKMYCGDDDETLKRNKSCLPRFSVKQIDFLAIRM